MFHNLKKRMLFILLFILLFATVYILLKIEFFPNYCDYKGDYGIIDEYLSFNPYDNVIYAQNIYASQCTHGDKMLEYSLVKNFTGNIYYYAAVNDTMKISSSSIIEGLCWMEKNKVSKVNISLSSKRFDETLKKWIEDHPDIQIFSSYNNKLNSYDYPSMYEGVIASGQTSKIEYKDYDRKYRSNRIIIWNKGIHYFYGNSFLSLETLLGT